MMLKTDKAPGLPWIAGTTTDHRSHGGAYLEMTCTVGDIVKLFNVYELLMGSANL
jgi:hypothetical protein